MKTAIKLILAAVLLILAIAAGGIGWLFFTLRPQWPPIPNPTGLLAECTHISDTAKEGRYPQDKWGPEIRGLKPRLVLVGDSGVNIIFSTGGISDSGWGYYVYPDLRTNSLLENKRLESELIQPGIFKCYYR